MCLLLSELVFVIVFVPGKIGLNIKFYPKMMHLVQQADGAWGEIQAQEAALPSRCLRPETLAQTFPFLS